jgi:hypothetical protein
MDSFTQYWKEFALIEVSEVGRNTLFRSASDSKAF